MKNYLTKGLSLIFTLVLVLSLSACKWNMSEDANATGKEGSIALLNEFFATTLEDPNFVVTYKSDDVAQYTENVLGKNSFVHNKNDDLTYAYIKDGFYYYVYTYKDIVDGEIVNGRYYLTSDESKQYYSEYAEDYYNNQYCQFLSNIRLMEMLKEEDGVTFSCDYHKEKEDEQSTSTVEFKYISEGGTITISATAKNDLVKTASMIVVDNTDPNGNRNLSLSFVYGNATIILPDTDAWAEEDFKVEEEEEPTPNELAIRARDEFLSEGGVYTDNIVITCKAYGSVMFVETLSNGIDKIDNKTYQTYTYAKLNAKEDFDYYYVYDGSEKYYKVNDPLTYGSASAKFYKEHVSLLEDNEEAVLECVVEGDTMNYTVKVNDATILQLTATKVDGKILSMTEIFNIGFPMTYEFTFEYDTAPLTEPDLTGFEDRS